MEAREAKEMTEKYLDSIDLSKVMSDIYKGIESEAKSGNFQASITWTEVNDTVLIEVNKLLIEKGYYVLECNLDVLKVSWR